ncbi:hypothetical protein A2572_03580 [Candidatus Collierbacteria bacterium RIFOXYD1_FULL_40_9]|uniref:Uncharacterized protein n=1 Tax=Candidatus Collierbacteria bacterium RIFOXYD1_FULL_40_9 TaxID=1817731 RepID=A0A1F5FTJ3_9BACT|nr:MAG: hypothetical protein A2572_03580 [Candidatus Collierbacteria bacterium RIFOXYD1_FULL_40_9]
MEIRGEVSKVYFGGWYQRTTLHLTEIFNFLEQGKSDLDLSRQKLASLRTEMRIKSVTREAGYLEYVKAVNEEGIEIKYFEDGLYVLSLESHNVPRAREVLQSYYETAFAPAFAYIFSLGAPTPKELANIKTIHPIAVGVIFGNPEKYVVDELKYGRVYSSLGSQELVVKKLPEYIFLVAKLRNKEMLESLVEMQIFFREFKDQLQKYLDIHRHLWEKISEIKEKKLIKGSEVEELRMELDSYQKTINLISSRINQMGSYVHTRADIAKQMKVAEQLDKIFQYKFDVLSNSHSYIKDIWVMTGNYLNTAIAVISEIKGQAMNKNIQSLQIITTYGVVGGIIGYLSRDSLPKITESGMVYFGVLVLVTALVNKFVAFVYRRSKYKLVFGERVKRL